MPIPPSGKVVHIRASLLGLSDGDTLSSFTDNAGASINSNTYPIYKTNIVNGKAVIRYNGSSQFLKTASNLDLSATDKVTIFLVLKTVSTDVKIVVEHGSSATLLIAFTNGNGIETGNNNSRFLTSESFTSSFKLLSVFSDKALSINETTVEVDASPSGGSYFTNTDGSGNFGSHVLYIGARNGTSLFCSYDLAELIVYNRILTSAEIAEVENELGAEYALSYYTPPGDANAPVIDSFTAAPASQTQINLAWTAHDEGGGSVANYDLEFSLTGADLQAASGTSGWTNLLSAQNQTSYQHTGRTANTQYFYRLRARDNATTPNVSAWSASDAKTWNVAPSFVTAANLGNANINEQADFVLETTGGNGTRVVEVQPGESLPDGITLVGTNGHTVRVNRSVTGTVNIPLRVRDDNNQSSNRTFTVTLVDPNDIPPITPVESLIDFDEIELDRKYLEGVTGGPTFLTSILGNPLGNQQRDTSRGEIIHVFEIAFRQKPEFMEDLRHFFITRLGRGIGFRFYPPRDNSWSNEEIATTSSSTATYKLIKTFTVGSRSVKHRILKPIPTLEVKINGDPSSNYSAFTVDYARGEIVFATPANLPNGGSLTVTGEYTLPMWFEVDEYPVAMFGNFEDLRIRVVEILPVAFGFDD